MVRNKWPKRSTLHCSRCFCINVGLIRPNIASRVLFDYTRFSQYIYLTNRPQYFLRDSRRHCIRELVSVSSTYTRLKIGSVGLDPRPSSNTKLNYKKVFPFMGWNLYKTFHTRNYISILYISFISN